MKEELKQMINAMLQELGFMIEAYNEEMIDTELGVSKEFVEQLKEFVLEAARQSYEKGLEDGCKEMEGSGRDLDNPIK